LFTASDFSNFFGHSPPPTMPNESSIGRTFSAQERDFSPHSKDRRKAGMAQSWNHSCQWLNMAGTRNLTLSVGTENGGSRPA